MYQVLFQWVFADFSHKIVTHSNTKTGSAISDAQLVPIGIPIT